jgi:hypothetical protein
MYNVMTRLIIYLFVVLLFTGCVSSRKLYQRGQYDMAIRKSVKKLRGNPEKTKEINILEKSYLAANENDNNRIKFLKTDGKPEMWNEVFLHYSQLKDRQELVRSVLPLKNESHIVDFPKIDYDKEIVDAKRNAAEYYYVHAKKLLTSNNRFDARDAYSEFRKVKEYYQNYEDVDKYMEQARMAGISNVYIFFDNSTIIKLPQEYGISLLDFNTSFLNSDWIKYTNQKTNNTFHNAIKINLKIIDISPEKLNQKESVQTKKIQDGWEYILDEHNNTIKDSLGNPIKGPRMVDVSCKVFETLQQKAAHLEGAIEYYETGNQTPLTIKPIASDFFFENRVVIANGDIRALDAETQKLVGKQPVPFPNNIDMIMGATDIFKKVMIDVLKDNKYIIK